MLLVKLKGGLGNQMFQYATAKSLAGDSQAIFIDYSFLQTFNKDTEHFTARNYELAIFENIHTRTAGKLQLHIYFSHSLFIKALKRLFNLSVKFIEQKGNELIPFDGFNKSDFVYLDGYFQSENYFSAIRPTLLKDFKFPQLDPENQALKELIVNDSQTVSVHVRRGDYLKSETVLNIHGVLPLSYYQTALGRLHAKYGKLNLMVFSDDIDWARENLKDEESAIYFINNNRGAHGWKDMALMTFCRHHIIANSSFSWWGAWLSESQGDTFAPRNWFNSENVAFEISDIIPGHWTII